MPPSAAIDDYLKTIYHHTEWQTEHITPSQLAAELGLAPSSVTEMVQKLAAQSLVSHRPYGPISLTADGERRAAAIIRRHRLMEVRLEDLVDRGRHAPTVAERPRVSSRRAAVCPE